MTYQSMSSINNFVLNNSSKVKLGLIQMVQTDVFIDLMEQDDHSYTRYYRITGSQFVTRDLITRRNRFIKMADNVQN